MSAESFRSSRERRVFVVAVVVSIVFWLLLTVSLVGLVYGPLVAFGVLVAHGLFLARVQNDGVRVGREQLPDLHARVVRACERLGLKEVPDVYVVQGHGMLNAFATKLLSRRFVLLNAELLSACDEVDDDGRALDFVIGHELGHHALGHLSLAALLAPARAMPLLGAAYSRACEYSCDACGLAVVGDDLDAASRALALLSVGGRVARRVDLDSYVAQVHASSGLLAGIVELNSSHPYLPKRIAALRALRGIARAPVVGRAVFAYPLAPLFHTGFLIAVVYGGVLAAIAVPNFVKYLDEAKAKQAASAPGAVDDVTAPAADTQAAASPEASLVRVAGDRWLRERAGDPVPGLAAGELERLVARATRAGASAVDIIALAQGAASPAALGVAVALPADKAARARLMKLCTETWNAHGTEGACVDDGSGEFVFDFRPSDPAAPAPAAADHGSTR
jgi:Zn-dependent protease with chaperone function